MRRLIILLTIFFASCSTYSENDLGRFDKKIKTWIKKQQTAFKRTESGLYYHFDNEGSGDKIKYTDSVSVIFKGSLRDGTVFEKEEKMQKPPVSEPNKGSSTTESRSSAKRERRTLQAENKVEEVRVCHTT